MHDAEDLRRAGCAPTVTELGALPNTVRRCMALVRFWMSELEADAVKGAAKGH